MKYWLPLVCLLIAPGCTSRAAASAPIQVPFDTADEAKAQNAVVDAVNATIAANDFARLSKMEAEFRASRARTPSGSWKLAIFHAALQYTLKDGLERDAGCTYRKAPFLARWAKAEPSSPAPAITDAASLRGVATKNQF
jgi:hypothetical protein